VGPKFWQTTRRDEHTEQANRIMLQPQPPLLTLVSLVDPSASLVVPLASRTATTIGRTSSPLLEHGAHPRLASRAHLGVLVPLHGGPVLRDLQSTNGTYVCRRGGAALRRLSPSDAWRIKDGDTITLGNPERVRVNGYKDGGNSEGGGWVANRLTFSVVLSPLVQPTTDDDDECAVCLHGLTDATYLACGHAFCAGCVAAMAAHMHAPCCALCRAPLRLLIED
jgi:pSer/pThr/pTyr-binding forkhead associated (FHA) protein